MFCIFYSNTLKLKNIIFSNSWSGSHITILINMFILIATYIKIEIAIFFSKYLKR